MTYSDADHGVFSQDPRGYFGGVVKYVVGMNCKTHTQYKSVAWRNTWNEIFHYSCWLRFFFIGLRVASCSKKYAIVIKGHLFGAAQSICK